MLFCYPIEKKKLLTDDTVKAKTFNVFFALLLIKKVNNEEVTGIINTNNKGMISIKNTDRKG